MDIVKWGMIGCGDVTERKSAPALYKCDHSMLCAVYSRTYEKAADYAKRHNIKTVYRTVEDLLNDKEINAIYIATPPEFHKDYTLKCLEAGKITYVEKPMALNYDECTAMIDKSKETGVPLYVAFYRRGLDKFLKIKQLIDSGEIGKVLCTEIKQLQKPRPDDYKNPLPWRLTPQAGGGKFVDIAVHVLDALSFFFGKITEASGLSANYAGLYPVEDTVTATYKFENGVIGSGLWCYVADTDLEQVTIIGSKGKITFSAMNMEPVVVESTDKPTQVFEFQMPEHIGQAYIQSIVNEILGIQKSNADTVCAAYVTKAVEKILKN